MTRKEQIKGLYALNDLSSGLEKNSKKLEKDLGESDCISRADAIRVASGYCHPSNVAAELAKLPSVTPPTRKGHWIECMPGGAEEWCYKCSECNFWKYKKTINLSKFKFCPNCGAKMEDV